MRSSGSSGGIRDRENCGGARNPTQIVVVVVRSRSSSRSSSSGNSV